MGEDDCGVPGPDRLVLQGSVVALQLPIVLLLVC
jgi:hypothetical protein